MSVSTGDVVAQVFTTANPTTGAAADADSLPTGVLWVDGVADAATVTIADATGTGRYTFSVTMPTLTTGQRVSVVVSATIATIACAGEVWSDQCSPAVNVTRVKGATIADLDGSGNVLAKLANTVTHGGADAELRLKKAEIINSDPYGTALLLNAAQIGGKGLNVQAGDEQNTGLYARWPLAQMQDVADSMALAPTPGTPADGSVYDLLANTGTSEVVQLDWHAWATPDGALAALYSDNAYDDLNDIGTTLTSEGDTGFAAWVLQEFDDALFVGVGKTPMNHIAAVVGSIATAGAAPTFEYALPEEGVSAMTVGSDGKLYVAGVDERTNTGDSSIYIRTTAGAWTRKQTVTGWQHICGIREDGTLWVAGQGAASVLMYSSDGGDTWTDTGLTLGRACDVIRLGSYVIATHWNGVATYTVHRTPTVPAFNWAPVAGIEGGIGRMVEWNGVIVGVDTSGNLFTVADDGTGTEYTPPFTLRQTYNNLAVDTDGYLCALGTTGVWRTADLATWKQVWSFSPADTVRALGLWGDNLVVSTDSATAQVLARPASPEAAEQQRMRDAMQLAPSTSTAATGSVDADIDAIKLITDAIDTSAVTVTSSNNAGVLTFTQGSTFNATVSGLTISATWAKLYFTLKESDYDTDDLALLQLVETNPSDGADGLLYLAGDAIASPITVSDGTLTVSQAGGTVAIAITDNATAALSKASGLVWDIKTKDAASATVQNTTGPASITRAVTQTI